MSTTHESFNVHRFRHYDVLVNCFVVALLISNLVAPKLTQIWGFVFSGAQLLFPLTYIFGDIFTEVYGYAGSRRAIWTGFMAQALLVGLGALIVALPPAPGWGDQECFAKIFGILGFLPRLAIASLVAFWVGEFANSFVMAKVKLITQGKWLWVRTISSTAVGQAVDTVLVMLIAFGGTIETSLMIQLMWNGYLIKVAYEVVATPLTYLIVNTLKKAEGVDIFDHNTDFNPFGGKL